MSCSSVLAARQPGWLEWSSDSNILRADVRLSFSNPIRLMGEGESSVQAVTTDKESARTLQGRYRPSTGTSAEKSRNALRHRRLYFGMTHLDVLSVDKDKIYNEKILLLVEVTLENIARELLSERNPLSLAVMSGLLALGLLMLILEAFVLYFGIRIASGITSAVKALHHGFAAARRYHLGGHQAQRQRHPEELNAIKHGRTLL